MPHQRFPVAKTHLAPLHDPWEIAIQFQRATNLFVIIEAATAASADIPRCEWITGNVVDLCTQRIHHWHGLFQHWARQLTTTTTTIISNYYYYYYYHSLHHHRARQLTTSTQSSQSYRVSPATWDQTVTCHPTRVNVPDLNLSEAGQYSIYLLLKDKRLSWPDRLVNTPRSFTWLRSPIQKVTTW